MRGRPLYLYFPSLTSKKVGLKSSSLIVVYACDDGDDDDDDARMIVVVRRLIGVAGGQYGIIEAAACFFTFFVVLAQHGFRPMDSIQLRATWEDASVSNVEDSYGQEWVRFIFILYLPVPLSTHNTTVLRSKI